MSTEYNIKTDERGLQIFNCKIEWTAVDGKTHVVETADAETAETVIGLLTGNITLSDLEP